MKKILLVASAAILITIILLFVLIPDTIVVSKVTYTNLKPASVLRCLRDDAKWEQWFPGSNNQDSYIYKGQKFEIGKRTYSSTDISIMRDNITYHSSINVIAISGDSSAIQWALSFKTSINFIKRFIQYQTAKDIKEDFEFLLDNFKTFILQPKNIYGFNVHQTTLTDTSLVAIKTVTTEYPSTQLIYSFVNQLKGYIQQQHATEHNFPMLNITQLQDSSYEVMVGIPTNVPLTGNNIIKPKRMVMLKDKTLVTDVTGDNNTIKKAFNATGNYMNDNGLSSPVIPFQQLVTDRSKEKDSTKWITKIFTPVS